MSEQTDVRVRWKFRYADGASATVVVTKPSGAAEDGWALSRLAAQQRQITADTVEVVREVLDGREHED
jgi:hypothetical protein